MVTGLGAIPQKTSAKPLDPSLAACTSIFLPSIKEELQRMGLTSTINIGGLGERGQTYSLNWKRLDQERLVVYGGPDDIQRDTDYDQEYDPVTKQYRYLGYGSGKNAYFNKDFPADALVTTDVSAREWIKEPWKKPLNSSYPNKQAEWYWQTSPAERAEWLKGIYDKYSKNSVNKAGNWTKFPPSWNEYIDQFFVWQQQPGPLFPGTVTGWHKGKTNDWYDTFYISPTESLIGDMAINPFDATVNETDRTVGINIWSNFQFRQTADLQYKFSEDATGNMLLQADQTLTGQAFDGYASTGAKKYPAITSVNANLLTPVTASNVCKDAERIAKVVNTTPKVILEHAYTQQAKTLMVGIFGDFAETSKNIPIPESAWKKLALGEDVYLTVSINNQKSPNELLWENNKAVWLLSAGTFKTPPIKYKDITTRSAIAYWDPLPPETVDHYDLVCTIDNKKINVGKKSEWALTGLTPNTTYKCDLEAFDPGGNGGGVEEGPFTTLPEDPIPPVDDPTNPGGQGGGWKQIGLIRELGASGTADGIGTKQTNPSATSYPKTVDEYKAIRTSPASANSRTPYFGEKIGMFAEPEIGSSTYSWKFTYQEEVYDNCRTTNAKGECVGGYRTETREDIDSCNVLYPMAGPNGLGSTTSNPSGRTSAITTKWGKTGTATVKTVGQGDCVGSHPKNNNKFQFTYYYPTLIEIAPTLLIDKGFNPTFQKIEDAWKNQWIMMDASSYSLGNDGRSLSAVKSPVNIGFKMLWSKYGNLGNGG